MSPRFVLGLASLLLLLLLTSPSHAAATERCEVMCNLADCVEHLQQMGADGEDQDAICAVADDLCGVSAVGGAEQDHYFDQIQAIYEKTGCPEDEFRR